jgi:O-succinylbenzoic acid--CoA ligase
VNLAADATIQIEADSLFRGYYPHQREAGPWSTDDRGRWDEHGSLHVLGRRDATIISGGEKIAPEEVEAVLRSTGQFADVAVVGVPEPEWGEVVVACYRVGPTPVDLAAAAGASPSNWPPRNGPSITCRWRLGRATNRAN